MAGGRGFILLAVALVAAWLVSGFYRVQPDEQGLVLRFGAFDRTTLPGLSYHLPWPIERVERPAVTASRSAIGRAPRTSAPRPAGTNWGATCWKKA
jgi:membrane protease subunit HflK